MIDREKIIKGMEEISDSYFGLYRKTEGYISIKAKEFYNIMEDAIILLKAQKPVLLKNQHKSGGHFINTNSPWKSTCPQCGKKIEGKQTRFCKYCGQAVKWE